MTDTESIIIVVVSLLFSALFFAGLGTGSARDDETPIERRKRQRDEYNKRNWDK